ncbi:MAG: tetratricopeptide repeat protein [Ignavibacteriaceae bacterium]|jgi:tetratricopeptide (TPR) repeat protein|nr:tetratricopeptide repeat protein [Ignavibacteriaceae bacterium]MCU0364384.1 tetratricopeptide repeat protein [Ignavibacteriaceae bacterium]
MKFKPIYLYGILVVAAVALLIIVGVRETSTSSEVPISTDQSMPDDDVHKQLKNQMNTSPGKENVSEEYRKKLSELKQAIDSNPSDTLAMRNYADFLSASHKMNEAIPYYEKILKVNPKRADIYFSLALIYYNKQDMAKCEELNNDVLSFDPKNQMALYNLGAIAATQGKSDKAKEFWNKVVSINAESETGKLAKESLGRL